MRPPVGAPTLSRRTRILLIAAGVLVVLLLGGSRMIDFYVDWLWFGEVGFRDVFTTVLFTRIVQFVLGGLLVGGLVALTLWIAYRFRPVFVPVTGPEDPIARYRTVIIQRLRLFAIGIPVAVGLVAGLAAQGDWQTVQMFLHSTPFGISDPEFGNDVSFYAFQLPFYRLLLSWFLVAVAVAFAVALITHYIFGGIRLTGRSGQVSAAARAQLATLAGAFVLLKAVAYYLDRFELLFSQRNRNFTGATYTDLNAVMPAKLILLFISLICAAAFFAAVFRRNLQLPAIAVVLLVLSSVLVGAAWPAVLQQFVVAPNANEREAPSIARNIEATRQAFGLTDDKVTIEPYSGTSTATPAAVRADTSTIPNIRLLDPNKLAKTFTQLQQRRNFYGFPEKLDIDRYKVNGQTQDYVVAARELDSSALVGNQTDWINRHLVYTHGNGFVAAPANQVNAALEDTGGQGGLPKFTVSDTTTRGDIPVAEPRIYYGELITDYSIVGADTGDAPREYDTDTSQYTYQGSGGVSIGNLFNRSVFALYYGERNILFNSSINANSKIMYVRDPRQRVEKAAPWLTVDGDPYPAVINGRIEWIVDGYTTLKNYPYAEKVPLGEATRDSLQGVQRLPNTDVSYLRNSVKATVDAYNGTVTLYAFDEKDPVLQTWMKTFPGVVKPASDISPELRAHFRYPEDQFKVQRELLTRYHVSDPGEFFSTVSFWDVPSDPTVQGNTGAAQDAQPPYYLMAGLPGQQGASFQLTSALVSLRRQFMAAYMSASSDPANYGHITVLQLPAETQTLGPQQVQAQFLGSPNVSQELNLLRQNQTTIDYGNLLTLPVAGGLLYVEPVYIERAGQDASYPQLARVLVSYGGRVGYSANLSSALDQVFGAGAGAAATSPGQSPSAAQTPAQGSAPAPAAGSGGQASPQVAAAANDIQSALAQLKQAQQSGDFAAQGQALAALDAAVKKFQAAQAAASTPTPGG
ncbi:UPF0182 family protein [Pseudonocardia acidicola]|uniref:UPF0182 protein HF526_07245 n=1 Tax=Pseudonocardia acidicola TaxID=2724939 RepID=A0ABX1S9S7_9PSEU|nr:UPF0182 family protein [Pseudonocardia acidicola]NMH97111.1 UPF0182 family protein [Pseudonocardia acidicola]